MQMITNKTQTPEWVAPSALAQSSDHLAEFEAVYLNAEDLSFQYDGETLTLSTKDGMFYPRVTLRRCFPLSGVDEFITVRSWDEEDSDKEIEIGIIRDARKLDPVSQSAVTRELTLHYFVPVIQRILDIREEFGFLHWKVETDRGSKEFTMRDSPIRAVRQIDATRWLLIDINKTRYEIRDQQSLDAHGQELLKRYLLL